MRKRNFTALVLAGALVAAPVPAYAAPSLADHMADSQGTMWNKLESWLTAWHAEQHGEVTPEPEPTAEPEPAPAPAPEPAPAPAPTGDQTNGKGGALTNRTFQSYTSAGQTSKYHIYADGLDWSKPVGMIVYGDGSGGYGFDNPGGSYLLGGSTGLVAVAKKHNMLLLAPEAPAPGCDGSDNCWYDSNGTKKAQWAGDLTRHVQSQYNVDKSRVVVGGYSSGAEFTTAFFGPQQAPSIMSDGLFVAISYGSPGYLKYSDVPQSFKDNVVVSWDVGSDDYYALQSARSGEAEYKRQGFTTDFNVVQGLGHSRYSNGVGHFGSILDREITQHVK